MTLTAAGALASGPSAEPEVRVTDRGAVLRLGNKASTLGMCVKAECEAEEGLLFLTYWIRLFVLTLLVGVRIK